MVDIVRNVRLVIVLWVVYIIFGVTAIGPANCQVMEAESDLPQELGTALGVLKSNLDLSAKSGFADFSHIYLKKLPNGRGGEAETVSGESVSIDGELVLSGNRIFRFLKADLGPRPTGEFERIYFKTQRVSDVSYVFNGRFLENKVQEIPGGNYTRAEGTLVKYVNGKERSRTKLRLYEYAEL